MSSQFQEEKPKKNKRNTHFTLRNIDIHGIEKKYGLIAVPLVNEIPSTNITMINELTNCNKKSHTFSYLDDSKKHLITMVDYITNQEPSNNVCCFWCRHPTPDKSYPIGCPIKYTPNKIVKTCSSEITKEKYTISQRITRNISDNITLEKDEHLITNGYYTVDGIFCSFNCTVSFIKDNIHKPMYKNSKNLLMKMYVDVFKPTKIENINPAPSWRLLKEYGGVMTIDEFRESFNNFIYIDKEYYISRLPITRMVGDVFEEYYVF